MNRRTLLWVAAALLGIAATATVAWSASRLAATSVGLAGAPLSVTSGLAPASTVVPGHARPAAPPHGAKPGRPAHRRPSPTAAASSTASAPTPLPVTPSPPVSHATVVVPPVPTATATTTTTVSALAPSQHRPAGHRDDSGGDGARTPHHGPDD